jgi:hypothetical protein
MDAEISDFDIAIIDSIKTIIEVLAKKRLATHEEFAESYRYQKDAALQSHNGPGAGVFELLVKFCETHGAAHALHRAPSGGSA